LDRCCSIKVELLPLLLPPPSLPLRWQRLIQLFWLLLLLLRWLLRLAIARLLLLLLLLLLIIASASAPARSLTCLLFRLHLLLAERSGREAAAPVDAQRL
jgi:hypothetical protein